MSSIAEASLARITDLYALTFLTLFYFIFIYFLIIFYFQYKNFFLV